MNKKYKPPCSTVISLIILITIILMILLIGISVFFNRQTFYTSVAVLISMTFFSCIYIPLAMNRISIYINNNEVIFKSGIITTCERRMIINRLELIYLVKTPFSKYTGLNFIVMCVYGKRLILPFLNIADAEEIIEFLCIKIKIKEQDYENY